MANNGKTITVELTESDLFIIRTACQDRLDLLETERKNEQGFHDSFNPQWVWLWNATFAVERIMDKLEQQRLSALGIPSSPDYFFFPTKEKENK